MSHRPIPTVGAHLSPEEKELFDEIADSAGETASWVAAQVLRHWMKAVAEGRQGVPPRKGHLTKPEDMPAFRARVLGALGVSAVSPPASAPTITARSRR